MTKRGVAAGQRPVSFARTQRGRDPEIRGPAAAIRSGDPIRHPVFAAPVFKEEQTGRLRVLPAIFVRCKSRCDTCRIVIKASLL